MALEKITFSDSIPGWIGGPKGKPAVIVLQEWWGITEEIKRQAQYISEETGSRVLVPDLYRGKMGVNGEEASHMMENLDWPRAIKDVAEAGKFLKSEGSPKIASIGFCMGGALALLSAEHADVDGAISFYGTPDPKLGHPEKIKIKVQCHSGTDDALKGFSDPATVKAWCEKIPNKNFEFYEYPGEGHAFMNSSPDIKELMAKADIPTDSDKSSQDKGWKRAFSYLKEALA